MYLANYPSQDSPTVFTDEPKITDPTKPKLVQYMRNTSNLLDGDISPEGMKFIPAAQSPTGVALLVVGYEVTGSVAVYQIK